MSLRMNLFGCQVDAIKSIIGSCDEQLLSQARLGLDEVFKDSDHNRDLAVKWLRHVVFNGVPIKDTSCSPLVPENGGLIVSHLEGEHHIYGFHCIIETMRPVTWLNLANESSDYTPAAFRRLFRELNDCDFFACDQCPDHMMSHIAAISDGTPLFGDRFHTNWSYYCLLEKHKLLEMQRGLNAALNYKKSIPDYVPDEVKKNYCLELSEGGREFARKVLGWMDLLIESNQDLYVLWS